MNAITIVFLIFLMCAYFWISYMISEYAEYLFGFNRYISFILCVVLTPILGWLIVIIIDNIRMR